MAALIDATTGYNVITDYGDDSLEDPHSGSGIAFPGAATGPQPYDDFNEVNSAENSLDSGSSLEFPKMLVQPAADLLTDGGGGGTGTLESWGVIE